MLKRVSFIIAVITLSFLIFLLARSPVIVQDIEKAEINQKIILEGIVNSARDLDNFKILLVNGTEVVCSCSQNYLNKHVQVTGLVEEYQNKKQIRALEIRTIININGPRA